MTKIRPEMEKRLAKNVKNRANQMDKVVRKYEELLVELRKLVQEIKDATQSKEG